jgi:hypothetical protein
VRVIALAAVLFLLAVLAGSGSAVEVSGAATLDNAGHALVGQLVSISCGAPGDCAAGGFYTDGIGHQQAFLVSETNGVWGKAIEVPGTARLNSGGFAAVKSVSCTAAGECAAGGYYADGRYYRGPYDSRSQAFVVSETNGTWGKAIEVPDTATLNAGAHAVVNSISCSAAGDCSAGGLYANRGNTYRAFVVDETNGRWGIAIKVRANGGVNSVSCTAVGQCTAGGDNNPGGSGRPFVVDETNGVWGTAIEVPGIGSLNPWHMGSVSAVSCAAPGECAAGGSYWDGHGYQVFVASESNGSWGDATEPPGWTSLNYTLSEAAGVSSVSCGAIGDCAAGGLYEGGGCFDAAWVVSETNGSWDNAIKVPGSGCNDVVSSISCAAAGECAAGGSSYGKPFVVSETNGSWGNAVDVPVPVATISCPAAGECAAGGGPYDGQPSVVSETSGSWSDAVPVRFAVSCVVPNIAGKTISAAKTMLRHAHCGLGRITSVYSARKKGLVIEQGPNAGGALTPGTPVALTVSKGKQPPASTRWRATRARLPANAASRDSQAVSITSISCASRRNCTAVGSYYGKGGDQEGLLLTENAGHWSRGIKAVLPANAASDPQVWLTSVSCASAGNCTAVGTYTGSGSIYSEDGGGGLLLTETAGHWARGVEATVHAGAIVTLHSVSCASAGNCTAVGNTADSYYCGSCSRGLVLTQKAGHWKRGVAYGAQSADIFSVSCSSDGGCGAVGYDTYDDGGRNGTPSGNPLLLTKKKGRWRDESWKVVWPGPGPGEAASLTSISCSSAGNCSAVGFSGLGIDEEYGPNGVLFTEKAGKWARGVIARPPKNAYSGYWNKRVDLFRISCSSPGNCGAIGTYYTHGNSEHWTLLTERAGKWRRGVAAALPPSVGPAQPVPSAVSCASPGNCTVVGGYSDDPEDVAVYGEDGTSGLLLTEIAGGLAHAVSAPFPTNWVSSVSCASPGNCGAVGGDSHGDGILLDSTTRGIG